MHFLYNILIGLASALLHLIAPFSQKIKAFVRGRRGLFQRLEQELDPHKPAIWVHAASLGEFEQGLPVIEEIRKNHPEHAVLVTFFSPSGYEVKKDSQQADLISYIPLDTVSNARKFIAIVRPVLAIFVKYEIWPNFMKELDKKNIPSLLISAIFSERQIYFKWYGGFMRRSLGCFKAVFVQNKASVALLESIGLKAVYLSGDTRFDRVAALRSRDNSLEFMEAFKGGQLCLVAGSSWPEDEKILVEYINTTKNDIRLVLAPHHIKPDSIQALRQQINRKTLLYSELESGSAAGFEVLIVDTIGLLTRIYSYADIAYVGGGFATGLHNTLEPAVFGIPVLIGPQYSKFNEAMDLVAKKGILVVTDFDSFRHQTDQLIADEEYRQHTGLINADYINANKGASVQIANAVRELL